MKKVFAQRPRSLRLRLLAATMVAMLVAVTLAWALLARLFDDHVMNQFATMLRSQLDLITTQFDCDGSGQPLLDARALTDPRWSRPYSGLYWQVDEGATDAPRRGVLRSRSLWDAELLAPPDAQPDGTVHLHRIAGPNGTHLLLAERTVVPDDGSGRPWRLLVAADLSEAEAAIHRFNGALAASLAMLLGLLCAAAVAQVRVGLAPLRALQRALVAVHEGRAQRLEGRFPAEVQPLTDGFNAVLDRNAEVVARARTQAGNLAHAIKTPLAAMAQAAASARQHPESAPELAPLVQEQVAVARRHVDWHLARSRAAAAQALPGARVALAPALAGLLRVMERVHAQRDLAFVCAPIDPEWSFAGETQDLQEILGNLLDNACKWARSEVRVHAALEADRRHPLLHVTIEDDGPGIESDRRDLVMTRGTRLDESVPGSGLGLAIVHELVSLYGGAVTLGDAARGGLRVELTLPAAIPRGGAR